MTTPLQHTSLGELGYSPLLSTSLGELGLLITEPVPPTRKKSPSETASGGSQFPSIRENEWFYEEIREEDEMIVLVLRAFLDLIQR